MSLTEIIVSCIGLFIIGLIAIALYPDPIGICLSVVGFFFYSLWFYSSLKKEIQ